MFKTVIVAGVLLGLSSLAQEPKTPAKNAKLKGSVTQQAPKLDLGLPTFGKVPTGEGLKKVEEKAPEDRSPGPEHARPTVITVQHGKGFLRTPSGAKPAAPYPAVTASGTPLMTEKFSTVIRVKNPDKKSTSIEVVVTDSRGDTVMNADGTLYFKGEEVDWTVDWAPTGIRSGGDFQVQIRVGGTPVGTYPLKIEAK